MKSCSTNSSKLDRKIIERNRRRHMKDLCSQLVSLIPGHHNSSKDILSQEDLLDLATSYIKQLQGKVEELKGRRQLLMSINGNNNDIRKVKTTGLKVPVLELRETGPTMQITLISGLNKNFMFYEVINVLKEEGAEVVNASFSTVGDKVFHTLHSQVTSSRVGVEISRLCERLKELVH